MFNLACAVLGDDLVTALTGCRRIVEVRDDGTYITADGTEWVHASNPDTQSVVGYLHGDRVCEHP